MTRLLLRPLLTAACVSLLGVLPLSAADALAEGFAQPPAQTKPWVYWYWISDNISKEGLTKDLEAMARVGIGEALIGNIFLENQPAGRIKVLTEEWWQLVEHAIREGGRTGVNIGLFNCPGWSQSGGPWITPEQTMRHVVSSELRVSGPTRFAGKLTAPREHFQDISVLAFPAPEDDGDTLARHGARVTVTPSAAQAPALIDGDLGTHFTFPVAVTGAKTPPFAVDIELETPITARSLQIHPAEEAFGADAELWAADSTGRLLSVRKFRCDRSNLSINVGPIPRGPVTVSFAPTASRHFRVTFANFFGRGKKVELAEIAISGAARLEAYVEKQLGKMHPTPLPLADTYVWDTPAEPDSSRYSVALAGVIDLSARLSRDGFLDWEVPAGEWIVQRIGMAPTGMKNSPASPEGQGFEVDKMNRRLAQQHFDAFIGRLLQRMPAPDRRALTRVIADSYEMGSQNWTDGFAESFRTTYGYDPIPWLPVLSGRILGSAAQSERFLWDLRRLVADRVATDYVGGLNAAARQRGLGLWLENYGHWGFPGEFLQYGGQSDRIGGEFWVTGDLGSIECRAASSAANTYGKPFVSAESFTGGPPFQNAPAALKARGDWSFCEGVNHVVLHVMITQPREDRVPGINAPWGTEFNRHNTWFEESRAWIEYERRSCWLLQQGWRVADVAYFIGEDAPKMTGARRPELPPGRDFDFINAEVLMRDLRVQEGRLVLPHGVSYQVLVLPPQATMRPAVLRKIRDLVNAGALILGTPPTQSPSRQDYPRADEEVRALAQEIWGSVEVGPQGRHQLGLGRVHWGQSLAEAFAETQSPPDVEFRGAASDARLLHTHRRSSEAEIYFLSNQKDRGERADVVFRVAGRQPELWDAVTGARRDLPDWRTDAGRTVVPLEFGGWQSWFVIFRKPAAPSGQRGNNFPSTQVVATLGGAWSVDFDPKWGGPGRVEFAELADWTRQSHPGVKHYSGRATYRKTFSHAGPGANAAGVRRRLLDLGSVRDVAVVSLNGIELGTLWMAPWQIDVTAALRTGDNVLEIAVINPWNNRLVGDLAVPAAERRTSLSLATIKPKAPLIPAGLLGPVTLREIDSRPQPAVR